MSERDTDPDQDAQVFLMPVIVCGRANQKTLETPVFPCMCNIC